MITIYENALGKKGNYTDLITLSVSKQQIAKTLTNVFQVNIVAKTFIKFAKRIS